MGAACPLTGIGGVVPIFVCAGRLQSFIRQLFVVHWLSFSGGCLLCVQLLKWQVLECLLHNFVVSPLNFVVSTFWDYKNLHHLLFSSQNFVVFSF